MKRATGMLLASVLFVIPSACSRDKSSQPHAVADPDNLGLAAISLSDVHLDQQLVGQSASADEAAKPAQAAAGGQPAAATVQVDQSSQDAAAKSYVDVINSGQLTQLSALLMQDQQAAATEVAQAVAPLAQSTAALQKALGEKFAGHAFVMTIQNDAIPADWIKHWTITGVEVDANDPNTATAKLQVENAQDAATKTLKKVEDKWFVQEANLPTADAVKAGQETITQLTEAFKALTAKVEGGEIADADAAEKEIGNAISNPAAAVTAEAPAKEKPAPGQAKAAGKKAHAAKGGNSDQPKSELEQDMDTAQRNTVLGGAP